MARVKAIYEIFTYDYKNGEMVLNEPLRTPFERDFKSVNAATEFASGLHSGASISHKRVLVRTRFRDGRSYDTV